MYKPPFELNENIVNLVSAITEKLTRLEFNFENRKDLYLRKASKIKSVNSSCAIENNILSEEEIFSIIDGKVVLAPQDQILEVKNAYSAYINMDNYNEYEVKSFLHAHKLLTTNLVKESGKFRTGDVGVFDGKQIIHMGARPEYVPSLINDLFIWAKSSDLNPLIKSSIIHFEIEFIHPFNDGNGRIGRLWQSLVLYKYNKIFEILPIETLIFENQEDYYNALSQSEKDASSTVFVEFMLNMILKTIEKFDTNYYLNKLKDNYIKTLSKTEKEILNQLLIYFTKIETIDVETAEIILNKTRVNIRKYFGKFVKSGILIPIGNNKGRKYKLNVEIFK